MISRQFSIIGALIIKSQLLNTSLKKKTFVTLDSIIIRLLFFKILLVHFLIKNNIFFKALDVPPNLL